MRTYLLLRDFDFATDTGHAEDSRFCTRLEQLCSVTNRGSKRPSSSFVRPDAS
jgi:hypothetical protein